MKGLIIKDLYSVSSQKRAMGLYVALIFIFVVFFKFDTSSIISMLAMMLILTSSTVFNFDETFKWDTYCLSLPLSHKQIVGSRYLVGLICSVMASLFSFVISVALSLAIGEPTSQIGSLALATLMIIAVSTLMNAIDYPIMYYFGAEKSRYAITILSLVLFFGFIAIVKLLDDKMSLQEWGDNLNFLSTQSKFLGVCVVVVSSLVLYGLSFVLSSRIYQKKEF